MVHVETYFATELVALGTVRMDERDSAWRETCWTGDQEGLGFPRRAFAVTPGVRGAQPEVVHPGQVTFPRPSVEYSRERIDPGGEETDWIWLRADLRDELAPSPSAAAPSASWRRAVPPRLLWAQRRLHFRAQAWCSRDEGDSAALETEVLDLVRSLGLSTPTNGFDADGGGARRNAIRRVIEALAADPCARRSNRELADIAGFTPSHFCVAFRRETGRTVSEYLQLLRLCTALDRLHERASDLSALAFDLGFSSHSHFTARFRSHFGRTPSEARAELTSRRELKSPAAGSIEVDRR